MGYGPSRQNRGAGNSGEQPVQFKLADAQRIANVVSTVEGSRRGKRGSTLPRAAGGGGGASASVYAATYTGAWPNGSSKNVSLTIGTAATTKVVVNTIGSIMPGGLRTCFVLQPQVNSGSWLLVNAEC
jgi:hypothetical protein